MMSAWTLVFLFGWFALASGAASILLCRAWLRRKRKRLVVTAQRQAVEMCDFARSVQQLKADLHRVHLL